MTPIFKNRLILCALLLGACVSLYFPVLSYGFLHFDDHRYLTQNLYVASGLTFSSMRWAFFYASEANWIPLTWLSHMLDVQIFGLNAAGHHAMNMLFHAFNGILLFLFLDEVTQRRDLSWLGAMLFIIHPMHVESVAWIFERKDVLSTFFVLLSFLAYVKSVRSLEKIQSLYFHCFCVLFYALSLLSKPMYVTFPLLLMVLDDWPLGRIQRWRDFAGSILTKIHFWIMAVAISWLTFQIHKHTGAVFNFTEMPLFMRLSTASLAIGEYFYKFLWPAPLSIFYPGFSAQALQNGIFIWGSILFLVTGLSWVMKRRAPWLFSGWMIFLIALLPVSGLIKAGDQAVADRYTYFSYIGLGIILLWGLDACIQKFPRIKKAVFFLFAVWILACSTLSVKRIHEWESTETLFQSAVQTHPHNHVAFKVLADDAYARQDLKAAADYLSQAIDVLSPEAESIRPEYELNLAIIYHQAGTFEKAAQFYEKVLQRMPLRPDIWAALGHVHMQMNLPAQARLDYEHALQIAPGNQELQGQLQKAKAAL